MLRIHKNTDGTYFISASLESNGHKIVDFTGNFTPVEGDHEQDPQGFSIEIKFEGEK